MRELKVGVIVVEWCSEEVIEECDVVIEVVLEESAANDMLEDIKKRIESRRSLDCARMTPSGSREVEARSMARVAREKVGG